LDEPAAGLDPALREEFLVDLSALVSQLDIATLYIGHHWDEISFVAGRVAYLLTETEESGTGCVRDIPVLGVDAFRDSPPTLDAFQAVYGPGCEIVPVEKTPGGVIRSPLSAASSLVACLPPTRDMRADQIIRSGPYRFPREAASTSSDGHTPKKAWIYKDRKFSTHANLETRS
jgi:energy-coupling factor transporter ATP-binding protein EcfA2